MLGAAIASTGAAERVALYEIENMTKEVVDLSRALLHAAVMRGLPPEMTAYESFRPPEEQGLPVEVEVRSSPPGADAHKH